MPFRRLAGLVMTTALLLAGCADRDGPATAQTATVERASTVGCVSLRPPPPFAGYRGGAIAPHSDLMTRC